MRTRRIGGLGVWVHNGGVWVHNGSVRSAGCVWRAVFGCRAEPILFVCAVTGLAAIAFGSAGTSASARATAAPAPMIGANYSHVGVNGCDFSNQGIVAYGARFPSLVTHQLAAMRAAGIETLRLFVWHMHDASGQSWGVVGSAGGRLGAIEEGNLIHYLTAVRAAGFKQLTVVFGPMWTNDPIGFPDNHYDPSLFEENWDMIRSVRGIVKQYGPASTHFDLLNEGAPSDYLATKTQLESYIAVMYSNYVDAFGNQDVTVSSIVAANDQSRISNLIDTLRSTGRPLPTWFEIHTYTDTILEDLRATDATLTSKGLTQPITIGETSYNNQAAADAAKAFVASSARPLAEVIEWPLRRNSGCRDISVAPPFQADAFITALTGSPPSKALTATVGPRSSISLTTAYGDPLSAIETGTYALNVGDLSRQDGFHLSGPGVNLATTARFKGTKHWTVVLKPGTYRYRSDRRSSTLRGTFVALATH
jgi:hypothetical protein